VTPSFRKISHGSKLQVASLTNGSFLQNETGPPIKVGPLLIAYTILSFFIKNKLKSYLKTL